MKISYKIKFIIIISLFFINSGFALTNNEIKEICRKERKSQDCIRKLKIRRYNLERGKPIEIPVIPFRK
tara:strand:+ start:19488 stop:19694 length:207 start_codon:yes stop_codon:yes gene_type:complete